MWSRKALEYVHNWTHLMKKSCKPDAFDKTASTRCYEIFLLNALETHHHHRRHHQHSSYRPKKQHRKLVNLIDVVKTI